MATGCIRGSNPAMRDDTSSPAGRHILILVNMGRSAAVFSDETQFFDGCRPISPVETDKLQTLAAPVGSVGSVVATKEFLPDHSEFLTGMGLVPSSDEAQCFQLSS